MSTASSFAISFSSSLTLENCSGVASSSSGSATGSGCDSNS